MTEEKLKGERMFRVFQIFSSISLHLVLPLILTGILTITYGYAIKNIIGNLEYALIVFFSSTIVFFISRKKKYWDCLEWISPFIILAISLFLTYCYLSGTWFWISFIALVLVTIVCGFFTIMLRSINVQ